MKVHLKAVKISDVICISTLLPNVASNFHAPKLCLEKVILVDLNHPFPWNLFIFPQSIHFVWKRCNVRLFVIRLNF